VWLKNLDLNFLIGLLLSKPDACQEMPERVYALDVCGSLMVVATAQRHVIAFNVAGQPQEHERKDSPLKFQTRCIACFPDQTGYAIGSIEGRVGIQYVQKVAGKESFAFKCHRQENDVFAVNDIAFNSIHGTFATVGSDGVCNFWDKDHKQRLKGFTSIQKPISCASFSTQGNLFAYAGSYDWSKGSMHLQSGNDIMIHFVADEEIRPKGKKSPSSYRR
jgi:mRNA export factor